MFRCSGLSGNFVRDHQIAISAGVEMANYVRGPYEKLIKGKQGPRR